MSRPGLLALEPEIVLAVICGPISLLIADSRSAFDSATHFYGGETTNLTLPATISADSVVCLGSDLVLAWCNLKRIFRVCFIRRVSTSLRPVVMEFSE